MKKKIFKLFFGLGLFLFTVNFIGLIVPLENKETYQQKSGFKNDITLSKKEALDGLTRLNKENTKDYVQKANKIFNQRILHYIP